MLGISTMIFQVVLLAILVRNLPFNLATSISAYLAAIPYYVLSKKIVWRDRLVLVPRGDLILFPVFLITKFTITFKLAGMAYLDSKGVPWQVSFISMQAAGAIPSYLFLDKITFGLMTRVIRRISREEAITA
jgi:putative flippase GtrA